MSKKLIITEKPSVAMEFAKVLKINSNRKNGYIESDDWIITWCVGHFAYIYGLYFKPALKIFKDKKYVDQLYNRFSFTNKDTAEKFKVIYEKAKQYIEEKG